jgi:hypothetical protein
MSMELILISTMKKIDEIEVLPKKGEIGDHQ